MFCIFIFVILYKMLKVIKWKYISHFWQLMPPSMQFNWFKPPLCFPNSSKAGKGQQVRHCTRILKVTFQKVQLKVTDCIWSHTWITEGLFVKFTCWTPTSCKTELIGLWSNLFLSRCIKWMLLPGPKMRIPPCWAGSPWKSKSGPVTARHRLWRLPESRFDFTWGLCPEEAISSPRFIPNLL